MSTADSNRKEALSSASSNREEASDDLPTSTSLSAHTRSCRGLRLYGKLVLDVLKQKRTTNFEEIVCAVQEDLVKAGMCPTGNDKSTRRRVYDVLNVLSAVEMISKDGKSIQWVDKQPCQTSQDQAQLQKIKQETEQSIQKKKSQLKDLLLQIITYKSLLVSKHNQPIQPDKRKIHLPFIAVKTDRRTNISCIVSEDKFDQPFVIHEDIEVLQRMGLAFGLETRNCTIEQLESCKSLVTKHFEQIKLSDTNYTNKDYSDF